MGIRIQIRLFIICTAVLITQMVSAQQQVDTIQTVVDSTILYKDVKVFKAFNPQIADAVKISKLPQIDDTTFTTKPALRYDIFSKPLTTEFGIMPLSPAKIKQKNEVKLPPFYSKIGFGLAALPIFEFGYNSPQNYNYKFGVFAKHYGLYNNVTIEDGNSVNSDYVENTISLFGSTIFADKEINANFQYDRLDYRYYGYPNIYEDRHLDKPSSYPPHNKQHINRLQTDIQLRRNNLDLELLHYDITPSFQYFSTKDEIRETQWGIALSLQKNIEKYLAELEIDFKQYDTRGIEGYTIVPHLSKDQSITYFRFSPSITSTSKQWNINLGLDIYYVDRFEIYPKLDITYNIYEDIIVPYAGFYGRLTPNNYSQIMLENRYIQPFLTVAPTNEKANLYAGVKGRFTKFVSYNVTGKITSAEDFYFFKTDPLHNKFVTIYDNGEVYNLQAELSVGIRENLDLIFSGNYYYYSLDSLGQEPLHKPNYEVYTTLDYRHKKYWKFNLTAFNIGKRYATDFNDYSQKKTLPSVFDLNFEIQYHYTKNWSFFMQMNNILDSQYFEFNGYPLVGFNALVGVTFLY